MEGLPLFLKMIETEIRTDFQKRSYTQSNNINLKLPAMRPEFYTLTVRGPFTNKEIKMVKQ